MRNKYLWPNAGDTEKTTMAGEGEAVITIGLARGCSRC